MKNKNIRALTYGAVCVAMSFALSYAVLFRLPQGGSITLASVVPIVLFVYLFGFRYGVLATVAFTLTQLINPYFVNPAQLILDYLIPYMALCLVGLVPKFTDRKTRKKSLDMHGTFGDNNGSTSKVTEWGIYVGMAIFTVIRFASQTLSGVLFFEAPLWFSMLYNSFGIVDSVIATIALVALFRSKAFKRELDRIRATNKELGRLRAIEVAGKKQSVQLETKEVAGNE